MTESMKKILAEKYSGSTVLREDANGLVIRNSVGAIEKVSESQAHQFNSGSDARAKRAHTAELAKKAKQNVQDERQINRQKKADAIAEVGESVRLQRERLQKENDFGQGYKL